eukprot:TRINITY_DN63970_c0_g1_i1.p1 TRINITY_DN63970_c0_g1~~TRINITY_DN63970_c0_g1_i1.p1  ORF type:complete len:380 (+),score=81.09 TRINITY_DN63970_c0_g1_i1:130-1140(+)
MEPPALPKDYVSCLQQPPLPFNVGKKLGIVEGGASSHGNSSNDVSMLLPRIKALEEEVAKLSKQQEVASQKIDEAETIHRGQLDCISERVFEAEKMQRMVQERTDDAIEKAAAAFQKTASNMEQERSNLMSVISQANKNFNHLSSELEQLTDRINHMGQELVQTQEEIALGANSTLAAEFTRLEELLRAVSEPPPMDRNPRRPCRQDSSDAILPDAIPRFANPMQPGMHANLVGGDARRRGDGRHPPSGFVEGFIEARVPSSPEHWLGEDERRRVYEDDNLGLFTDPDLDLAAGGVLREQMSMPIPISPEDLAWQGGVQADFVRQPQRATQTQWKL